MNQFTNRSEHPAQTQAVFENGHWLAQHDDCHELFPWHFGQPGDHAEQVIGGDGHEDGNREEAVEALATVEVVLVLVQRLFGDDEAHEAAAVMTDQREAQHGADCDADVVVDEAPLSAENCDGGDGGETTGDDGKDDLDRLQKNEDGRTHDTGAIDDPLERGHGGEVAGAVTQIGDEY